MNEPLLSLPVKHFDGDKLYYHIDTFYGADNLGRYLSLDRKSEIFELSGWAIDPLLMRPLGQIVIYVGDIAIKGEYGLPRQDISEWLGGSVLNCGFRITVPKELVYKETPRQITVLMLGQDGSYRFPEVVFTLFYLLPGYQYDIGVYGCWAEPNYGSELTYFALYNVIQEMGFNPIFIERPLGAPWHSENYPLLFRQNPYMPYEICPPSYNKNDMRRLNNICSTFVVGSDQMWHQNLNRDFGDTCFLDFIDSNKKIISYATSFGREYWTGSESERGEIAYYLKRFNSISVREQSGIDLCRDLFGVSAEWALDPVLLCPKEKFEHLTENGRTLNSVPFVGAYILDVSPEKEEALRNVADRLELPLEIITDAKTPSFEQWSLPVRQDASVEDWLRMFRDADFIVTDSFHGMCLCLVFEKPFVAILNQGRGAARFLDYARIFNLEGHIVSTAKNILTCPTIFDLLDYSTITKNIKNAAQASQKWLYQAITSPKDTIARSAFDILSHKLDQKISESDVDFQKRLDDLEKITLDRITDSRNRLSDDIQFLKASMSEYEKRYVLNTDFDLQMSQLREQLQDLSFTLQHCETNLNDIKNSLSYKIGYTITWILRKIRDRFKNR